MGETVRSLVDQYERVFVYSLDNARNNHLKDLRAEFKSDSRFYQGKNKLTQVALGKSDENEYKTGIHKISQQLIGEVGLLFTNRSAEQVEEYFNKYNRAAFARSNDLSNVTVLVKTGPLPQFSHALEGHLRERLKLPVRLNAGRVSRKGRRSNPARSIALVETVWLRYCRFQRETGQQMGERERRVRVDRWVDFVGQAHLQRNHSRGRRSKVGVA